MEVVERRGRVMASELHVLAVGAPVGLVDESIELVAALERIWSRFLPESDITRINLGAGTTVTVSPQTVLLVETMLDGWAQTGGRYDPSVLPALVAAGYERSVVDAGMVTRLGPPPWRIAAMAEVRADARRSTVALPLGAALDPGGIGKGLAADLAVAFLLGGGAAGALVGIGGDLVVHGLAPTDDGWVIDVEDPLSAEVPGTPILRLTLDAGGVATSSTRSRRWQHDGLEHHHTIDPSTGRSRDTDLASVTVVGRSGWLAEVHASAALSCGSVGVLGYLADAGLSGVAVVDDGSVLATDDLMSNRSGAR